MWVQTSHLLMMAQILRMCAVLALDSTHFDRGADSAQEREVFEEKVRSRLCKADVDGRVLIG
jgi:hypothetical protein